MLLAFASVADAGPKQDKKLTEALGVPVYVLGCKAGAGCLKEAILACGSPEFKVISEVAKRRALTYGTLRVSNDTEMTVACGVAL